MVVRVHDEGWGFHRSVIGTSANALQNGGCSADWGDSVVEIHLMDINLLGGSLAAGVVGFA